jgi:hypothetical protein
MTASAHDPFDNPRLLVDIVKSDRGCEIFAASCEAGAEVFTRISGLESVRCNRTAITSHEGLFWDELKNVGPTKEPFLLAAALYRFLCITQPFLLVRKGAGQLLHPVVAEHPNAAAGFRLCYELGEALITRVQWTGQPVGFDRYFFEYSADFLARSAVPEAVDVEVRFQLMFTGRRAGA